jgi:NADPH:quinone reductase-like Zn-dependent oxidoreductase
MNMKAVVYERYGTPDVLKLREIQRPVPKANEVLVKIFSTTVTAGDWRMRKADPFLVRLFSGLFRPRRVKILGFELAGVVEEVGKDVTAFKKGDEVFADCGFKFGAYAEYKCLPVDNCIAIKPANVSFDEAAAVPIGGLTALRLLKEAGIRKDIDVLIYGASGSVGTYAIQIAKTHGARVTAVCSGKNIAFVESLGADHVIDYTLNDFTKVERTMDIVFDAVGKTSKKACRNILKPDGRYVTVAGNPRKNSDDMQVLRLMMEQGTLKPVIDKVYMLPQIREAHAYVELFHKRGNVVVRVVEQQ